MRSVFCRPSEAAATLGRVGKNGVIVGTAPAGENSRLCAALETRKRCITFAGAALAKARFEGFLASPTFFGASVVLLSFALLFLVG